MKRWISLFCCIAMLATALFSLGACGKKLSKNLDEMAESGNSQTSADAIPSEVETNEDGERLNPPTFPNINGVAGSTSVVSVTDEAGSAVTDAAGNAVTAVVDSNGATVNASLPGGTGTEENSTAPAIRIAADKKKDLKVGDTVNVTVGIRNAKWLADITVNLYYDQNYLTIQKVKAASITDLMTEQKDQGAYLMFAAYTMRTVDIPDSDLFTVTFLVNKQPSGENKITYATANVFQWDMGKDAEGNGTTSIVGTVPPVEVALHIDG